MRPSGPGRPIAAPEHSGNGPIGFHRELTDQSESRAQVNGARHNRSTLMMGGGSPVRVSGGGASSSLR